MPLGIISLIVAGKCVNRTIGTTLEVNNVSHTCDIVSTRCDGVDLNDFEGKGCPTYNFQNQYIAKGSNVRHHQEVGYYAKNCPWTLHFKFSCGAVSVVRGHQQRAVKGHNSYCTKRSDCFRVKYSPEHYIKHEIKHKNKDFIVIVSDKKFHREFMKSKKLDDEAKKSMATDPDFIAGVIGRSAKINNTERYLKNLNDALKLTGQSLNHAKASGDKGRIKAAQSLRDEVTGKIKFVKESPAYAKKIKESLNRLKENKSDTKQQINAILPKINILLRSIELYELDLNMGNVPIIEDIAEVKSSVTRFRNDMNQKLSIIKIKEFINLGQLDKAENALHFAALRCVMGITSDNTEIDKLFKTIKDLREDRQAENLRQTGIGYTKALRFDDARTVFNQAMAMAHDLGLKQKITSDIQNAWDCEAENIKKNALQLAKQNLYDKALSKLEEASKIKTSQSVGESIKIARMQILNDQVTWMRKQGDELVSKSKFDEAYNWFDTAVPIPCSPDCKQKVYLSQANAYWAHAKFWTDRDEFQKAHEKFDMALKVQNERLKEEKTIVKITNDKAGAYCKEGLAHFKNACELEDRVDQHEEMCLESQTLFDKAKELFNKAHSLNASNDNSNNLKMCNSKIDGNDVYNKGTDLVVDGINLLQNSHKKQDFELDQKKFLDAMDEFLKAKKLFKEGSKLCKGNLFESSIKSTKDAIGVTKDMLKATSMNLLKLGDTKLNTMLENEKNMAGTSKTEKEYQMIVDKA